MRGDHSKHIVLKLISTDLLFTKFAATSLCDTFIAYNGTYFLLTVPQKVCWNRYRFHCEPTSYLTQSSRENCRFLESPDIEMGLYCLATRYCLPDILGVSAGILTTARVGIDQIRTQWNCAFLTIPLWRALEWIRTLIRSGQSSAECGSALITTRYIAAVAFVPNNIFFWSFTKQADKAQGCSSWERLER